MKLNTLLSFILLALVSSCSKSTCEDFKTGTYIYADPEHSNRSFSRVLTGEREFEVKDGDSWKTITKSVGTQVETDMIDSVKVETTYDIIWDGACDYTLAFRSVNKPKYDYHNKYDSVRVSVLSIEGNSFNFQSRVNGESISGAVIKVSDEVVEVTDEMSQ